MSESYSRLYHRFPTEFPAVWADDRAFAAWTRLLILADASWPMRPPLPRSVRPKVVTMLEDAGLIYLEGDQYVIRGLDAERTRRRDAARTGAAKRWQSDGNANASADAMPSTRRDETRTSKETKEIPPPPAERGRRANQTNLRATGDAPRQNGHAPRQTKTSPRDVRQAQKRGSVGLNVHETLRRAAALGSQE
jgi:hypothetical protein